MFQMGNNTAVEVPADVVAAFGAGKRPPVVVRVNDRVPVDRRPMGGMYLLPFSAERRGIRHPGRRCHRRQVDAGYRARAVEVPEDLQAALDASPSAAARLGQVV